MIAEANPQVKKAVVRLMELSGDERTRMLKESRQKVKKRKTNGDCTNGDCT